MTIHIGDVVCVLVGAAFTSTLLGVAINACVVILVRLCLLGLHEAAHAIAAMLAGLDVEAVHVGWSSGYMRYAASDQRRSSARIPPVACTLGTMVAAGPGCTMYAAVTAMLLPVDGLVPFAVAVLGLWMATPVGGSANDWSRLYYLIAVGVFEFEASEEAA